MFNWVRLICFQQYCDLEVAFGEGFMVICGVNESGKSTLLCGICYGGFGVK